MEYERKDFDQTGKTVSADELINQSRTRIWDEPKTANSPHFHKPEPETFGQEDKKRPKRNIGKLKNYLILVLVAALFVSWIGPGINDKVNITGAITGIFVDDYSKQSGLENGAYYLGNPKAKVTVVEFSDFECPFCNRVKPAIKQMKEEYVKTGKVKLVFRHLPLSFHRNAEPAAIASLCAGRQGKFWEYHDKLFANQNALSATNLKKYASDMKLDMSKFSSCLRDPKISQQVQADKMAANKAGIRGTPGFLINGETLSGAQPYSKFKEVIEKKLKS